MPLPITAFYSGILVMIVLAFAYNVSLTRRREKIGLGDADNESMRVAQRIHGNAIEILPVALILMLIYELNGGNAILLHVFGLTLILGRFMHAYGLGRKTGRSFGRYWGTAITWAGVAIFAAINILSFVVS